MKTLILVFVKRVRIWLCVSELGSLLICYNLIGGGAEKKRWTLFCLFPRAAYAIVCSVINIGLRSLSEQVLLCHLSTQINKKDVFFLLDFQTSLPYLCGYYYRCPV